MNGARRIVCGIPPLCCDDRQLGRIGQIAKKDSAREKLIGACRLVLYRFTRHRWKVSIWPSTEGMLIYTEDGHMSVQLMYPGPAGQSVERIRAEGVRGVIWQF